MIYTIRAGVGGRWADAWFNLGLAGTAGVCFILVGPVCRCTGVAGAWFILTREKMYPSDALFKGT